MYESQQSVLKTKTDKGQPQTLTWQGFSECVCCFFCTLHFTNNDLFFRCMNSYYLLFLKILCVFPSLIEPQLFAKCFLLDISMFLFGLLLDVAGPVGSRRSLAFILLCPSSSGPRSSRHRGCVIKIKNLYQ